VLLWVPCGLCVPLDFFNSEFLFCVFVVALSMSYAELHCVSNFSFLRGASWPQELTAQACAMGYTALAITDECSMAGVVRAYEAFRDHKEWGESGFKLIVGSEFTTSDGLKLVLLAPTQKAYAQICGVITQGRMRSKKGSYQLTRADF